MLDLDVQFHLIIKYKSIIGWSNYLMLIFGKIDCWKQFVVMNQLIYNKRLPPTDHWIITISYQLSLISYQLQKAYYLSLIYKKHKDIDKSYLLNPFIWYFQVVFWSVVPTLLRQDKIKILMTILLLIFLFQFLPKAYHSFYLMRKMQKVTGYIFGTIWWGFGLNLVAYFIASHVSHILNHLW